MMPYFLNFEVKPLWKTGIFTLPLYYITVFKQEMHSLFRFKSFGIPDLRFFKNRLNLTGK
jgi:hypothetical protein